MKYFLKGTLFKIPEVPKFAQKYFDEHYIEADRVMLSLLVIQWVIATFVTSLMYDTYLYGFFSGALITLPLFAAYRYFKGTVVMRALIAIGMMLFSLVFIQQYLGRIEMHFHVFIVLAIMTLYKDIVPVFVAAATTIIHHLVFNYLQLYEINLFGMPVMIFNYGCGMDIVLLHAIFVVSEALVITYIIKTHIKYSVDLYRSEQEVLGLNKELSFTSLHDVLTGLPNRHNLHSQLDLMVANAKRYQSKFAVLFLDLDHFKNVNDTLGHNIGDELLKAVAHKLKSIVRENDIISRIGGDEFIIVLNDVTNMHNLEQVILKILEAFRKEWVIKGHYLHLSTSIGAAIYPDDSKEISELMKYADIAMYKAKSEGRDQFSFFTNELNLQIHEEVRIANDMHRALDENEFVLYYQPKIEISTGKIIGAEALIRWNHYEKGIVYPNDFIHVAENTGFITKLGTWVIHETARMLARLKSHGYGDIHISCNVSTRQFQNPALYDDINNAIGTYAVNPQKFAIEITESVMMEHLDVTMETLTKIKSIGVNICMDDFGTGYSSLSYLRQMPIDSLKIDKSFVDDITENGNNDQVLINTIIAMGKSLNLNVIAEGVDKSYQLDFLRSIGCGYYQGYYFAKPVNEESFISLLETHSAK